MDTTFALSTFGCSALYPTGLNCRDRFQRRGTPVVLCAAQPGKQRALHRRQAVGLERGRVSQVAELEPAGQHAADGSNAPVRAYTG